MWTYIAAFMLGATALLVLILIGLALLVRAWWLDGTRRLRRVTLARRQLDRQQRLGYSVQEVLGTLKLHQEALSRMHSAQHATFEMTKHLVNIHTAEQPPVVLGAFGVIPPASA